jgi:hypothetical protein
VHLCSPVKNSIALNPWCVKPIIPPSGRQTILQVTAVPAGLQVTPAAGDLKVASTVLGGEVSGFPLLALRLDAGNL